MTQQAARRRKGGTTAVLLPMLLTAYCMLSATALVISVLGNTNDRRSRMTMSTIKLTLTQILIILAVTFSLMTVLNNTKKKREREKKVKDCCSFIRASSRTSFIDVFVFAMG